MSGRRVTSEHDVRHALQAINQEAQDDLFADDFDQQDEQTARHPKKERPSSAGAVRMGQPPGDRPTAMESSWRRRFVRELLTNSLLMPTFLVIYLLTCHPDEGLHLLPMTLVIIAIPFIQSSLLIGRGGTARDHALLGNLTGPLLAALAWLIYLQEAIPIDMIVIYAGLGSSIGIIRAIRPLLPRGMKDAAVVLKDALRIMTAFAMAVVVYRQRQGGACHLEPELLFLGIAMACIGLMMGMVRLTDTRHLESLGILTRQLAILSDWSMGTSRVRRALTSRHGMGPQRQIRAVLFGDIRGFTAWSESRAPEQVLELLNRFYTCAEQAWGSHKPIKSKFTADEVLMIFDDPLVAATVALELVGRSQDILSEHGLGLGVGLHHGPLIEGLFGSDSVKTFDVLGDTVNTGKRICDNAKAHEVLCSFLFYSTFPDRLIVSDSQNTRVKGKSQVLILARLIGVRDAPSAPVRA